MHIRTKSTFDSINPKFYVSHMENQHCLLLLSYKFIIDMILLDVNGKKYIKELAIAKYCICAETTFSVYTFRLPLDSYFLSEFERKKFNKAYLNVHGLSWDDGDHDYSELPEILMNCSGTHMYVNDYIKMVVLKEFLPPQSHQFIRYLPVLNDINLWLDNIYNCPNHHNYRKECALNNIFKFFIQNLKLLIKDIIDDDFLRPFIYEDTYYLLPIEYFGSPPPTPPTTPTPPTPPTTPPTSPKNLFFNTEEPLDLSMKVPKPDSINIDTLDSSPPPLSTIPSTSVTSPSSLNHKKFPIFLQQTLLHNCLYISLESLQIEYTTHLPESLNLEFLIDKPHVQPILEINHTLNYTYLPSTELTFTLTENKPNFAPATYRQHNILVQLINLSQSEFQPQSLSQLKSFVTEQRGNFDVESGAFLRQIQLYQYAEHTHNIKLNESVVSILKTTSKRLFIDKWLDSQKIYLQNFGSQVEEGELSHFRDISDRELLPQAEQQQAEQQQAEQQQAEQNILNPRQMETFQPNFTLQQWIDTTTQSQPEQQQQQRSQSQPQQPQQQQLQIESPWTRPQEESSFRPYTSTSQQKQITDGTIQRRPRKRRQEPLLFYKQEQQQEQEQQQQPHQQQQQQQQQQQHPLFNSVLHQQMQPSLDRNQTQTNGTQITYYQHLHEHLHKHQHQVIDQRHSHSSASTSAAAAAAAAAEAAAAQQQQHHLFMQKNLFQQHYLNNNYNYLQRNYDNQQQQQQQRQQQQQQQQRQQQQNFQNYHQHQ